MGLADYGFIIGAIILVALLIITKPRKDDHDKA